MGCIITGRKAKKSERLVEKLSDFRVRAQYDVSVMNRSKSKDVLLEQTSDTSSPHSCYHVEVPQAAAFIGLAVDTTDRHKFPIVEDGKECLSYF